VAPRNSKKSPNSSPLQDDRPNPLAALIPFSALDPLKWVRFFNCPAERSKEFEKIAESVTPQDDRPNSLAALIPFSALDPLKWVRFFNCPAERSKEFEKIAESVTPPGRPAKSTRSLDPVSPPSIHKMGSFFQLPSGTLQGIRKNRRIRHPSRTTGQIHSQPRSRFSTLDL
jgi:hypothetical protein